MTDSSDQVAETRLRIGAELRKCREAAGKSLRVAAARVDRDTSWLSRVENGRLGMRPAEMRELLLFYGVGQRQLLEEAAAQHYAGRLRPRGTCQVCRRDVAVAPASGLVGQHLDPGTDDWCDGQDRRPVPQAQIDAEILARLVAKYPEQARELVARLPE